MQALEQLDVCSKVSTCLKQHKAETLERAERGKKGCMNTCNLSIWKYCLPKEKHAREIKTLRYNTVSLLRMNFQVENFQRCKRACPPLSVSCCAVLLYFSKCARGHIGHVQLCAVLWTTACEDPLSMGFSRQEYYSGLP